MPPRLRKLIGTVLLIALVVLYALIASAVAVARLQDTHWVVQLAFFLFSGLLWVVPAMFLISWMAKPGRKRG